MLKRYRILRDGKELELVYAHSSREAVENYVDNNIPEFESDGWSSRDFLKYSIKVESCSHFTLPRVSDKLESEYQEEPESDHVDVRFTLWQMFLLMTVSCVVMSVAVQTVWLYYIAFGLIILAPMIVYHLIHKGQYRSRHRHM